MDGISVIEALNAIVPITRFNRGEANRIFDEVESCGTKIVMKNNRPVCILMSPRQYEALMEMLTDYISAEETETRMAHYNPKETLSEEEVMKSLGITPEDLNDVDVEIE